MRIDIVTSGLRGGGAERVACNLSSGLAASGHHVRLITFESLDLIEYIPDERVEVLCLDQNWRNSRNAFARVIKRLAKLRALLLSRNSGDVVVAMQGNIAIEVGLATICSKIKIIGCERNIPDRAVHGHIWKFLRPMVYQRFSAITTQTVGSKSELSRIVKNVPIYVVGNILKYPMNTGSPHIKVSEVVPPGRKLLLAAGRLSYEKGFDVLLNRFCNLLNYRDDIHLVIVGEGPLRSELESQIDNLGIRDYVGLPGRSGNIADWYKASSVFLMTSRWEGMPNVLIEAMAHQAACVVTDFPHGPRDVIQQENEGTIVSVEDEAEWQDAVNKLLDNEKFRQEVSINSSKVRERFSDVAIIGEWMKILNDVKATLK